MSYLEVKNVSKSYGSKEVLRNINMSIKKNEFVTLLGPSGCGKTTLLRSITGLESLDSGQIILDKKDISNKKPRERDIGMIFQSYCLFPTMNVFHNVAYGLKLKKMSKEQIEKEVLVTLKAVNLEDRSKSFPAELSGGEKQRIALARTLIMKPKVLLLDEPFNAIDAKLRKALQLKVKEIHKEYAMTSIMVTHDQDEAMIMSDTIHLFRDGVIEQSGSPSELYLHPKTKYVASFMGNYNVIEAKNFKKITSGMYRGEQLVALRPETIEIQEKEFKNKDRGYYIQGRLESYNLQGNIVSLVIDSRGVKINVDTLVDKFYKRSYNEKIYLRVLPDKMLFYD